MDSDSIKYMVSFLQYEPETKEAHNKRMESIRRVKRRIAAERE